MEMSQSSKKLAIILSILIVAACLAYAFIKPGFVSASVDEKKSEPVQPEDSLSIISTLSAVTVTADPDAEAVTAHLYGTFIGFGNKPELAISRSGSAVTVRAGKQGTVGIGWNVSMKLDIIIPAGYKGDFNCQSSAGSVTIASNMDVKSFSAHSSAGAVRVQDVNASGTVDVYSSAGSVETGAIYASAADIHTSAGSVHVKSCVAGTIRLQSSAGSVTAEGLSGSVDASSSAGSVDIALADIRGGVSATSSAGRVSVSLPAGSNAEIDASTSAGSVSVRNLALANQTQKRNSITGTLGSGGPKIYVHSSAGSVEVIGK
jgi:hypothetical protein